MDLNKNKMQEKKDKKYKAEYIVLDEWETYHPKEEYIDDCKFANSVMVKKGIVPEHHYPGFGCYGFGFCKREQKWYGWSQRGIYGFGIGHVVKKEDGISKSGWPDDHLLEHPKQDKSVKIGFVTKTLEDCKKLAIAISDCCK